MPHEVIMPALGMSQDSGVLMAWRKAPGDPVKASDILMEVETDKATVEVEAGFDGYVTELRIAEGEEAPVGGVIAVISDSPDDAKPAPTANGGAAERAEPAPQAGEAEQSEAPPAAPAAPAEAKPAPAPLPAAGGRILASPKARRLAQERGIDLQALVRQGLPQPLHAADLDRLEPEAAAAPAAGAAHLSAEIAAAEFEGLLAWAEGEGGAPLVPAAVWAGFAAGALRAAAGREDGPLHVRARSAGPGGAAGLYADPDRTPLGALAEAGAEAAPDLVLNDLCATRLSAARLPGDGAAPVVTVARAGAGRLRLDLDFAPGALDPDAAIALLDDLARRAETPLRHLL